MKHGLPYKGSKNKLAPKIFEFFPKRKNFYDLFCGGCAMTHYGMLYNKFDKFIINDINPQCTTLFVDAIKGKYANETRWISREDFFRLKDTDAYVAFCWSFGNDCMTYLYGRTIEPYKKACHYAIVFDDWSLIEQLCPEILECSKNALCGIQDIHDRRLAFMKAMNGFKCERSHLQSLESLERLERLESLESLERLERLQSLERLESLESLERLQSYSTDYQNIKIDKDSVIYCDIPYQNTNKYNNMGFDYERFYAWCERQTEPLFISSYEMPEDRFVCIASFGHRSTLCATANNKVFEKVFIPKHQANDYKVPGLLFEL